MQPAAAQHPYRPSAISGGAGVASVLSILVFVCAAIVFFASPGKVKLTYPAGDGYGATGYATGFAPWGIRAAIAGLVAFAGIGIAILLATRLGDGWPAMGLIVTAAAFLWIARFSWNYRQMWVDRASKTNEYTVESYGPSAIVAVVGVIGAISCIFLIFWTVRRATSSKG